MTNSSKDIWDALEEVRQQQQKQASLYDSECEEYWNALPYEEKLKAFYSVIKRLVRGEVHDQGSYRHVLYDVFEFGPESYSIGIECGFLTLHNLIVTEEELSKISHIRLTESGYNSVESSSVELQLDDDHDTV